MQLPDRIGSGQPNAVEYGVELQLAPTDNNGFNDNQVWHLGVCQGSEGPAENVYIGTAGQRFAHQSTILPGPIFLIAESSGGTPEKYGFLQTGVPISSNCSTPAAEAWVLVPQGSGYWIKDSAGNCLSAVANPEQGYYTRLDPCSTAVGGEPQIWTLMPDPG
jgi:hypothetical protein